MNPYKNDLENIVVTSLKNGSKEKFETLEKPYSQDPLSLLNPKNEFTEDSIELFVGREAEIKVISKIIGTYKNLEKSIHIAIVGSINCGKRTTLKIITNIIKRVFPNISYEYYDSYDYKRNKEQELEAFPTEYKDIKYKDGYHTEIEDKEVDIRILPFSETDPFHEKINISLRKSKITFSLWNIYQFSSELKEKVDKIILFNKFSKDEIIEILTTRVKKTLIDKTKLPIFKEIITKISNVAMGNLKVSFVLFERINQLLDFEEEEQIDQELIHFQELAHTKLTNNELRILNYYMKTYDNNKSISTSRIVENLGYNNSNAWKYMITLVKKGVFIETQHGNPSYYEISEDFLLIYEDWKRKEIANY